jgi:hypothetical protein
VSPSTVIFSYAIGLIFTISGIAFLIALDDNRWLYGIPYLLIGLVIIGGVVGSQRRLHRKALEAEAREGRDGRPGGGRESPY